MTSQRYRRRWLILWGVACIGVAVASILLAWGCALWSPARTQSGILRAAADDELSVLISRHGDFDSFTYMSRGGFGWQTERIVGGAPTVPRSTASLRRMRAGWPLFCVEGYWRRIDGETVEDDLLPAARWAGANRTGLGWLPLRPRWSGLLGNVILLGLPLHIAFVWHAIRRTRRGRRRMCVTCGYDLRAATTREARCPECGTPPAT